MKRREFITLIGGAAASWPLAAHAQQPVMPVIGYLNSVTPEGYPSGYLPALRQGLKESGYVESENVAIEYRWAENEPERLAALAADLVRRQVKVIVAWGPPASMAAVRATATIPIVFAVPEDPVRLGLVASLARPGGNATGVNVFAAELAAKRLEFLREFVPSVNRVAVLLNPAEPTIAAANLRDVEAAATALAVQIRVFNASTIAEIDTAFAALASERPDALFVSSGLFFLIRRVQIAHLATRYAIPAIASPRAYPEAGGLMSYGTNLSDAHHQVGIYVGRILKGAKPADLPVVQSTKFELIIKRLHCQDARPQRAAISTSHRRRGDRVTLVLHTHVAASADPAEAGLLIGVLQKLRSEAGPCWTADFDPFVLMCSPGRPARVKVGTWIKKWTVVVDAAQLR